MIAAQYLPWVFFFIISFGLLMYMALDGFVLGVGVLLPLASGASQQHAMMQAVSSFRDGYEAWLVVSLFSLMAAFPGAYAVILSSLYIPVLGLLFGLICRHVAFTFYRRAFARVWVTVFHWSSLLVAFAQGVILGSLVEGMPFQMDKYLEGALGWFSPFAMLIGAAMVFGYSLLGATWLACKTEAPLQQRVCDWARFLLWGVLGFLLLLGTWLPFILPAGEYGIAASVLWLYWGGIPVLALLVAIGLWYFIGRKPKWAAFVLTIGLFILAYIELVMALWPNLVPPDLSIKSTASPVMSQQFILPGVIVLLITLLGYTCFSWYKAHNAEKPSR